jgi:glycosyltransferase involved in cell wall biosynthesis
MKLNLMRLDQTYSTARIVTTERPDIKMDQQTVLPQCLFRLPNTNRKYEGGLRTKGYFKISLSNKPLITVITAVLNGAEYLEESIQSVINQTYDNVEYIVIDGGSEDGTIDLIKKNEDMIDYWVSEPDLGIYDAWNKAVILAHGEWLVFLGSGDTYTSSAISIYVKSIIDSEIIQDFVSSRVHLVNSNKNVLRVWGAPFVWKELRRAMKFAHVGALHHRSLFEKYGLFDTSFNSAGDYDFFMRCGKDLRTQFIDVVTADVLVGGISMDSKIALQETCRIQKKYGLNPMLADYYYAIARLKQKLRPSFRGY